MYKERENKRYTHDIGSKEKVIYTLVISIIIILPVFAIAAIVKSI